MNGPSIQTLHLGGMQTVQGQRILRRGYTTGTTAVAAASYALLCMDEALGNADRGSENAQEQHMQGHPYPIKTPSGITVDVEIKEATGSTQWAHATAIKDSGDDPDVTHRAEITVALSIEAIDAPMPSVRDYLYRLSLTDFESEQIVTTEDEAQWERVRRGCKESVEPCTIVAVRGGIGVGTVTKRGLSPDVGHAAINKGPRSFLVSQITSMLKERPRLCAALANRTLVVTVHVQDGEALAQKTFNPKLGIVGGISIIGTSGIVEPMSEKALVDTIKTELNQFAEEGKGRTLLICPGNYGQTFIEETLGIDLERSIKISNYIGEALDYIVYLGIERVLFVGHAGKLIKLAAGVMNTHSSYADGRAEIIASNAGCCGASPESMRRIMDGISIDEMLEALAQNGVKIYTNTMQRISEAIGRSIAHRTKDAVQIEYVVFTNEQGILFQSAGAEALAQSIQEEQ